MDLDLRRPFLHTFFGYVVTAANEEETYGYGYGYGSYRARPYARSETASVGSGV